MGLIILKKEQRVLGVSAIINLIVAILKLSGGIIFNSQAVISDGIYTISDFTTDFMAMIGARVGHKRANKKHPFGYGRFLNIMQVFIGVLIFLVGVLIIYLGVSAKHTTPNLKILFLIILVIFLKILSANYLMQKGKEITSLMLINSAKESFIDVISSSLLFITIILSKAWPIFDLIGCLFVALLIFIQALDMIINNVILIIGEDDNNKEIKKEIKNIINSSEKIQYADSFLIKNGEYYQVTINLAVDKDLTVKDLLKAELKIKKEIKKKRQLKIKYIDFEVSN